MKTISFFLALFNSLFAGFLILFNLSGVEIQQAAAGWLLIKILAAGSIILTGVLTWIGTIGYVKPGLTALASLYLVAIGAATAVWTFHLAQATGDMEYYMLLYGGSLMIQGIALLFGISQDLGSPSAAQAGR